MAWHFPGFTIILFSLKQFKLTLRLDSRNALSFKIVFAKQGEDKGHLKNYAQLLIQRNKRSNQKTSYLKWSLELIPGEHLKNYPQYNFEYHLSWPITPCLSIMTRCRLQCLYKLWNHEHQVKSPVNGGVFYQRL